MIQEYFDVYFISLSVKASNWPASHLYHNNLWLEFRGFEKGYYADKEDAYIKWENILKKIKKKFLW